MRAADGMRTVSPRRSWWVVAESAWTALGSSDCDADVVILDWADLPDDRRTAAVRRLGGVIDEVSKAGHEVFVRLPAACPAEALSACVRSTLSGLVLAGTEQVSDVRHVDNSLAALEASAGLTLGSTEIVLSYESAIGNLYASELTSCSSRVSAITLGRADLEMDLGPAPDGETHLLPFLMQRLLMVAEGTGRVPIGAWWRPPARGFRADVADTVRAAIDGRAAGFAGVMVADACQVPPVNEVFTPTAEEVSVASELLRRTDAAWDGPWRVDLEPVRRRAKFVLSGLREPDHVID